MKLSIVVLNYNTKELTKKCLLSLSKVLGETNFEIIVIDNASSDGSVEFFRKLQIKGLRFDLIENKSNLGFAGGNNSAKKICKGEYVLFLNSDTEVYKNTLKETVKYLDENSEVGAITCKIVLPDGSLDRDARRSFPTPWVALTHFVGLDRVFPRSKIFAKYWYGYKDPEEIQEVDALQGAYFMVRKETLDEVGWFSEDYFLDGEDIDLCWRIKEKGLKIMYYPKVSILHIKKASKKGRRSARTVMAGVNSMEIFYKKHLWERYPLAVNFTVLVAIYLMKVLRFIKVVLHL